MNIKKEIKLIRLNTSLRLLRFLDKWLILRTIDRKQVEKYRFLFITATAMLVFVTMLGLSNYLSAGWLLLMYMFLLPSSVYCGTSYRMKAVFIIKPLTRFYWEAKKNV